VSTLCSAGLIWFLVGGYTYCCYASLVPNPEAEENRDAQSPAKAHRQRHRGVVHTARQTQTAPARARTQTPDAVTPLQTALPTLLAQRLASARQ
jgi:hypothetical protein